MRPFQWSTFFVLGICILGGAFNCVWAADFIVSSPQLKNGGKMQEEQVLDGFGCAGGNISPALIWKHPPAGTKSFAVTVYDPDAPTGSGWWHWVVFNIQADLRQLPAGVGNGHLSPEVKGIVQSMTDFGKTGYGGACPPKGHGPHRYIFTVYALDVASLSLDASAPAAMVGFYLNQHLIEKAHLTATYGR